jgi:transposase-like protein
MKRKRRQWSVKEKLYTIQLFEKNQNKHKTSNITGCTRAQLRNWNENFFS